MCILLCEPARHLTSHFKLRPGRIFVRGALLSIFASSTCQHTILQKKSIGKEKKKKATDRTQYNNVTHLRLCTLASMESVLTDPKCSNDDCS